MSSVWTCGRYGHRLDDDETLQWLALPGAKFRFDGVEGEGTLRGATYRFTQVER